LIHSFFNSLIHLWNVQSHSLHFIFSATSCDSLHAYGYILVSWYYVKEIKDVCHCYFTTEFYIYVYNALHAYVD